MADGPLFVRFFWFLLLWAAGVLSVGAAGMLIRTIIVT